jgi:ATP-dependent Clp protease ATP-binding subunit ClpX
MGEEYVSNASDGGTKPFSVEDIHKALTHHVKGQEAALTILSVLLSMHMRWFETKVMDHPSPNAIMIGPTGVGKTYTIQRAADLLRVPYVIVDTTALVPAGIVGLQIEDVAEELVASARALLTGRRIDASSRLVGAKLEGERGVSAPVGEVVPASSFVEDLRRTLSKSVEGPTARMAENAGDRVVDDAVRLAEKGIVFFDEFDKIAVSDPKERKGGQVSSAQVQRRLLKFIEGSAVRVGVKSHTVTTRDHFLDTSGILCIASGAFADLAEARRRRGHELARFRSTAAGDVIPQDMIEYGFMPELIARLPVIVQYQDLDVVALRRILEDMEEGPLRVWHDYFESIGLSMRLADDVLQVVAEFAHALKLGARGLSQILFPILAQATSMASSSGSTSIELRSDQFLAHPNM